MQTTAADVVDLSREDQATREMYGIDDKRTADFGRKCLLARRLVERGVRFIQIYSGGSHNDDNWDAHADLVDVAVPERRQRALDLRALRIEDPGTVGDVDSDRELHGRILTGASPSGRPRTSWRTTAR